MARGPVSIDPHLRGILQAARRHAGGLSQRAAAKRAGISSVYWQKIESGAAPTVPAGTLAAMFQATGVSATCLRDEGYPGVAAALDTLTAVEHSAEEHLAATPGATAEEISALQAVWQALRARRTTEPLEPDLEQHSRRNSRK